MAKWEFSTPLTDSLSAIKCETKSFDYGSTFYIGFRLGNQKQAYGFFVNIHKDKPRTIARLLIKTGFNILRRKPKVILSKACWNYHLDRGDDEHMAYD